MFAFILRFAGSGGFLLSGSALVSVTTAAPCARHNKTRTMPIITDPKQCPICGHPNDCALAAGVESNERCWCFNKVFPPELLVRIPAHARQKACICQRCWNQAAAQAAGVGSTLEAP